jgi:hypothetical protein
MNEEVKIVYEMKDDPTVSRDEIMNFFCAASIAIM